MGRHSCPPDRDLARAIIGLWAVLGEGLPDPVDITLANAFRELRQEAGRRSPARITNALDAIEWAERTLGHQAPHAEDAPIPF